MNDEVNPIYSNKAQIAFVTLKPVFEFNLIIQNQSMHKIKSNVRKEIEFNALTTFDANLAIPSK